MHLRLQLPQVVVGGILGQSLVEVAKLARAPGVRSTVERLQSHGHVQPEQLPGESTVSQAVSGLLVLVEVHRQFETARHQLAGLRTLRTQLGKRLVDTDHLPRQRVERLLVKFDPVPQLSSPAVPRLRAEEPRACRGDNTQLDMHAEHRRTHKHTSADTHTGN